MREEFERLVMVRLPGLAAERNRQYVMNTYDAMTSLNPYFSKEDLDKKYSYCISICTIANQTAAHCLQEIQVITRMFNKFPYSIKVPRNGIQQ
ncbi:hypothetical protein SAMN04515674_12172 [Pseudarcicella hirudinis]|uniref:Uncharacterized protein n=1 Tax=Pseudarcicella hirudinis TaxID=1079859 RepID=A0A1I5X5Z2_9BACT|nr:hypothetical protein [Pseudarcicella hirudinis]SFQ27370.1 hypothetical protein SAMN04515674_113158 [Pseudarcicella hirudinis]SFQ47718.1 hypothetical protein SAMN04515674_12172 [Pseudarcicella hirudinis]